MKSLLNPIVAIIIITEFQIIVLSIVLPEVTDKTIEFWLGLMIPHVLLIYPASTIFTWFAGGFSIKNFKGSLFALLSYIIAAIWGVYFLFIWESSWIYF